MKFLFKLMNSKLCFFNLSLRWYDQAKLLKYVNSQEEMNPYLDSFEKYQKIHWLEYFYSVRKFLFLARFYTYYALF